MAYHFEIWDAPECDSGTRQSVIVGVVAGLQKTSLAADETLELTATRFDSEGNDWAWYDDLAIDTIIRIEDSDTDDVWEWRVSGINEVRADNGHAFLSIVGDPLLWDLKNFLVEYQPSGGTMRRNLGAIRLTAHQIIDTYVIGNTNCPSWIVRGTVTPTDWVELAWDGYTALELLRDLTAKFPDYELRLRRNGSTDYRIDIAETGSGTTTAPVEFGRNLLTVKKAVSTTGLASVIVPRGRVPSGALEFGDIGDNAWEITAKSGDDLTLADPLGGDGPIGEDDQLNGYYLESATETTRLEISDSVESTQICTMASTPSDFAVGDLVRVVRDSSGSLLSELPSPSAITAYSRRVGIFDRPDQPTSRNYAPGGTLSQLTGWGDVTTRLVAATVDGVHSSTTTLNLKDLPVGLVVGTDALIHQTSSGYFNNASAADWDFAVSSGDTADGSGDATVTIDSAITASDGELLLLVTGIDISGDVDGWPTLGGSDLCSLGSLDTGQAADKYALGYPLSAADGWPSDLVGTVDGDHLTTSVRYIDITGLSASTYFPPGFRVNFTDNTATDRVKTGACGFVTDGSGAARVHFENSTLGNAASDGSAAWLTYPGDPNTWAVSVGDYVLVAHDPFDSQYLSFPGIAVRYVPGKASVYVGAGFTLWNDGKTYAQSSSTTEMARIELDSRELGSAGAYDTDTFYASDSDITTSAYAESHHDISGSITIAEDKELVCKVYPFRASIGGSTKQILWTMAEYLQALRYVSVWLGPETEPPITPGSLANTLWQDANSRLSVVSSPEVSYQISLRDLTKVPGFDASDERLVLGATVPIEDSDLGIDVDARIIAISYDFADPLNTQVVLEKTVRLASKKLMNPRYTIRRPESDQTTELTGPEVRPAVREDGAWRSVAPANSTGGVVTPTEY